MVDDRKRLTTNIVFLLSSLSAVLSMAVHIFIALLLHLKTQQEFLTAQATLKRNEFVCVWVVRLVSRLRKLIGLKETALTGIA